MKFGFILGALMASVCVLPAVSDARPGDHEANCSRHGKIDCSRPECAQFCRGNQRNTRHEAPPPGRHHAKPAPPPAPAPAVVTRPIPKPVPAPNQVVVTRPIPAPVPPPPVVVVEKRRPLYEIERDISRLNAENNRLIERLRIERERAANEYQFCRSSVPVYVANRCVYDESVIRSVQADIDVNRASIQRLEDEKRFR